MESNYSYCRIKTCKVLTNIEFYTSADGELGEIVKFIVNIVKDNGSTYIYDIYTIIYNNSGNCIFDRVQNLINIHFEPLSYSWLNRKGNTVFLKTYS